MFNTNPLLAAAAANGARGALNGGTLYIFAGTPPLTPDDPLDMDNTHTQLAAITAGGGGLNFDTAVDAFLYKSVSETWTGLVAFDGFDDSETTLTATFFRFCPSGDNGRGTGAGPRLQGTVSGQSGNGDVKLQSAALTANGSNEVGLAGFYIEFTNLAS